MLENVNVSSRLPGPRKRWLVVCVFFLAILVVWGSVIGAEVLVPLPGDPGHGSGSADDPNVFIPLPGAGSGVKAPGKPPKPPVHAPEIPLPKGPGGSNPDGSIVVEPPAPTPPPPPPPSQPQGANAAGSGGLPVFPKDTSSPIFMVMKTWECNGYDGKTLLNHAAQVYSKESEDMYQVAGVDQLPDFQVTLKENDITLDEMLDILAQQHSFEWGVDTVHKTLYLYPKKSAKP